jgi:hypothetical protein
MALRPQQKVELAFNPRDRFMAGDDRGHRLFCIVAKRRIVDQTHDGAEPEHVAPQFSGGLRRRHFKVGHGSPMAMSSRR